MIGNEERHIAERPLLSSDDRAASLDARLTALTTELDADIGVVLVVEGLEFTVAAAVASSPVPQIGLRLPGGDDTLCGFAAREKGPVIFDNVLETRRFKDTAMATSFKAASSVVVALRNEGQLLGVLGVHSRTPRRFTRSEAKAVERAAEGIVLRLAGARTGYND